MIRKYNKIKFSKVFQKEIFVPKISKNSFIIRAFAGQANPVTRLPSTIAYKIQKFKFIYAYMYIYKNSINK